MEAVQLDELMRRYGITDVPLLKLDIEGAEIEVIADMMQKKIYPQQILVEYNEISRPSPYSRIELNLPIRRCWRTAISWFMMTER